MGISNRDYYRDDNDRPRGFGEGYAGGAWMVWQRILAITVAVFVAQMLVPAVTYWFELAPVEVLQGGQIWRLLTYAFLHSTREIFHILFNMLLLFFFGRRLESMYGGKEFGLFYCTSAIFAGLCFLLWGVSFRDMTPVIGASGAVMAVTILYALHFPREKVYLWGLIAVEMRWLAAFILIIDLHPVLLQLGGGQVNDLVAHTAHLGGALFAWIYFRQKFRIANWTAPLERMLPQRGSLGRKPTLKIYREEPEENLESEVDRLLQKIQDQGEASLTDRERKTLQRAAERYKNRRQ